MQHTNDDIDELFRNAADNYPLKIKGMDWDSVAGRLNDGGDSVSPVIPMSSSNLNKNYRYLLLLLLIPIGVLTARYAGWMDNGSATNASSATAATSKTTSATAQKSTANPAPGTEKPAADNIATPANTAVQPATNSATAANTAQLATAGGTKAAKQNATQQMMVGKAAKGTTAATDNTGSKGNAFPLSELGKVNKQTELEQSISKYPSSNVANPAEPVNKITPNSNVAAAKENDALQAGKPAEDDGIAKGTQAQANIAQPAIQQPTPEDKLGDGDGVTVTKPNHFYIGAFVAPDYTTVKYQPGNKVGFDFGGLVGYKFSKSLSVELGLSVDKKYYTTDGKYYNIANQKWLESAGKLLTLSGYSTLTEFPLNLKYSFRQGKHGDGGNFFITGGLVSYIVHEENYTYEFDKNGYIYERDKSSKKSTTNMFANFSISAGYESPLGNNIKFRVEPYYRVPVSGIGLGGLPITSVGLNIGVTKELGLKKKKK